MFLQQHQAAVHRKLLIVYEVRSRFVVHRDIKTKTSESSIYIVLHGFAIICICIWPIYGMVFSIVLLWESLLVLHHLVKSDISQTTYINATFEGTSYFCTPH